MQIPKIGKKAHLERIRPRTGNLFQIPAYGYLERIEIRWPIPIPNMNASNQIEFILERLPEGFEITGLFWSVEDAT